MSILLQRQKMRNIHIVLYFLVLIFATVNGQITGCTPTWTSLADSNVLHGRLNAADSLSECQTACFDDADCTGVDWDPANGNGQYCWFSGSWSGRRNVNGAPGVTHYDLTRDCERCWTSHNNTNVDRGQSRTASTVAACLTACTNDSQCTGVDYIPTNPANLRCWLSGPWSGQRNDGTTFGVIHYDIDRDCIAKLNGTVPPTDCPTDIVFVMDESGSISENSFILMKSFLSQLVGRLDIDSGSTRVGVVTFSSDVGTAINLNAHTSAASLQSAISSLGQARGSTNTAAALAYVRTKMLTSATGDRSNVSNVVVVLTDGQSDNSAATQLEADKLRRLSVGGTRTKVVALGIGSGVVQAELDKIASAPKDKNVIRVGDFRSLTDVEELLKITSCSVLPLTPIDCPSDIIFVLDQSGSIGGPNFGLMKSFLAQLVGRLDIDSGNTRVGLITFSSTPGSGFNLSTHSSVAAVQSAISSLTYSGGGTNTADALAHVRTVMLTSATGDRSNIPNVVVVLTDGNSNNPQATQAEANKLKDIIVGGRRTKVISLGIGSGVSQTELDNIASAPKDKNVIRVQSFSSLTDVEDQLRNTSCTVPAMDCPVDIVFVMDESGSITGTDFSLMKSFLSQLVGRLDIDSGNTRVGLVTFALNVGTRINLNAHASARSLQSAISSLTQASGGTNTAGALAYVRTMMLTSATGDRSDVPDVVVVLTDGNSINATATQVEADKLKSVIVGGTRPKVVALGIGSSVSQAELTNIASAPHNKNVIRVQNFNSLTDVEEQLRNTSCTVPPVDCPVDVVFVLDESGSMTDFGLMKSFVSRLVGRLDIDSGNTRVGLITFSTTPGSGFNLSTHSSVAAVQSAISSLTFSGGVSNTDAALAYVRTVMLTSAAGDRSNVPNVVVVLTGGKSNRMLTKMEADKLKDMTTGGTRTKLIALGIGSGVNEAELNDIASAPVDKNVILVQDYSSLPGVEERLTNASCSVPPMDCPSDIIFVVDQSGSIGPQNFAKVQSFLSQLVGRLDIDSGSTRVGVITFSSGVGSGFNLSTHSSVAAVQSAISSLTYSGGGTNTADALAHVRTVMLTSAAGDRGNVPNAVVVLTDGQSNSQSSTRAEAKLLKSLTSGGTTTKVVALGIGSGIDQSELQDIASSPQVSNVILIPDFKDLTSVEVRLRKQSCSAQPVNCPVDIVFVLDNSININAANFGLMKSFVSRLVQRLEIDSGNTRVGLITFSTQVRLGFDLNAHSSVAAVQSAISSLTYQGGSSNTAAALTYVRTSMLTSAAGDRSNVSNVVVLLTDGQSDNSATAQSEAKLLRGVQSGGSATKVITLGIGSNIIEWLLEAMASEPHDKNVVLVQGYSSLPLVEEQLANESCRAQPIHCPYDVVFVLDESGSIGSTNFDLVKTFLIQLVGRLDIDSGNTRVALVAFSSGVRFIFKLNTHNSVSSIKAAISSLGYSRGGTNTARALAYVRTAVLTLAAGDRGDVPNIVVVITDGRSNDPQATQMEADRLRSIISAGIRGAQTKVVAVGIGSSVSKTELMGIASAPRNSNVISVSDFNSLSTAENQLRNSGCTPDPVKCPLDIVIVLDESSSIGTSNFNLVKSFLSQLVGYLDIDSGNARVGFVSYASSLGSTFTLSAYSSAASVQAAILSLTYTGGGTNTAAALGYVRTVMLTSAAGDRNNVPNVVILLTDGQSSDQAATLTQASQVKAVISGGRHTKIVVLGIGSSVSESELNAIASAPARKNVIRVQDFTSLMTVRDQLRDASCTAQVAQFEVDVIFVLDASRSIGSAIFAQTKVFVTQIIDYFDVDSGLVRVGACSYSESVNSNFYLNAHSTAIAVKAAVLLLSYSGGNANTAAALAFVRTMMLTSAAGDRSNVPNLIVVFTDGPSSNPLGAQAQANLLKNLALTGTRTTIVTVGIGIDVSMAELKRLASGPGNSIVIPNPGNATLQPSFEQQLINTLFGKCVADVVIVLDTSISVGWNNFTHIKSFLSKLTDHVISNINVDSGRIPVGMLTYSSTGRQLFNLSSFTSAAAIQAVISSFSYSSGATNTAGALAYVRTTMLTSLAGARDDVPKVVIVLTDGKSSNPRATQREAQLLKDMNMTRVVAIGIGADVNIGTAELYNIASHPHDLNVIVAPDFSSLTASNVEQHVVQAICAPESTDDGMGKSDSCVNVYPSGWVFLKSTQKYYRAIFELMDWKKADMRCRELGPYSRLVDVNNIAENMAIKTFTASFDDRLSRICEGPSMFGLPGYQGYWTSGQRTNSSSCTTPWVWKTFVGSYNTVSFTDWADNEPSCVGGAETCLQLTTVNYLGQRWADINCGWVLCPLCESDI